MGAAPGVQPSLAGLLAVPLTLPEASAHQHHAWVQALPREWVSQSRHGSRGRSRCPSHTSTHTHRVQRVRSSRRQTRTAASHPAACRSAGRSQPTVLGSVSCAWAQDASLAVHPACCRTGRARTCLGRASASSSLRPLPGRGAALVEARPSSKLSTCEARLWSLQRSRLSDSSTVDLRALSRTDDSDSSTHARDRECKGALACATRLRGSLSAPVRHGQRGGSLGQGRPSSDRKRKVGGQGWPGDRPGLRPALAASPGLGLGWVGLGSRPGLAMRHFAMAPSAAAWPATRPPRPPLTDAAPPQRWGTGRWLFFSSTGVPGVPHTPKVTAKGVSHPCADGQRS